MAVSRRTKDVKKMDKCNIVIIGSLLLLIVQKIGMCRASNYSYVCIIGSCPFITTKNFSFMRQVFLLTKTNNYATKMLFCGDFFPLFIMYKLVLVVSQLPTTYMSV